MINRLKRIPELRHRISTQLYVGIGGGVAFTIAASLVGWFSFDRVGDAQSQVNEGSVPEMAAAFGVARYGASLVAAGPSLTASTTLEEFDDVAANIDITHREFETQLAALEADRMKESGVVGQHDARFERIRSDADTLLLNIDSIESGVLESFELAERSQALQLELTDLRAQLESIIVPALDDQLFYTITGYRGLDDPAAPRDVHFSQAELARYRYLAEIQADSNIASQLLASAFTVSHASLIEPLRERFESAAGHIERNLSALERTQLHENLAPVLGRLLELGSGPDSGFDLYSRELYLTERQSGLLTSNQDIAVDLVGEVDGLVIAARLDAEEATLASSQAVLTGRTLLLVITGISVGGALLIAYLFVGRLLVRRLQMLSVWMRRMAGGDLESQVEIGGRDEVADMAAALEVFRRHALEVQRLNLVEKLAEELQGKNDELESVLVELRTAQDQIVMREKLAALGELTAGVAHEIRNPLNFVKNFSEVSEELLTELRETLEEGDGQLTQDQQALIQDISQDLTENLERIRSHGDRADRIVHDMLSMSRGPGAPQLTDINRLLDEHARLAYHSARATDPDFQLDLRSDLDPGTGELEVIAQDLGRVFLNMVSNACYATDEKRRAGIQAGQSDGYMPTLWLATHRGEDLVEVHIRDNGNGIPPDVVEKIFNPFFTTKPTDKGTGLGLAICSDIVRQHGGAIRVDSESGQFTEMTIELPLTAPSPAAVEEADAEPGRV